MNINPRPATKKSRANEDILFLTTEGNVVRGRQAISLMMIATTYMTMNPDGLGYPVYNYDNVVSWIPISELKAQMQTPDLSIKPVTKAYILSHLGDISNWYLESSSDPTIDAVGQSAYKFDAADVDSIIEMITKDQYAEAYAKINDLDTFVRDRILSDDNIVEFFEVEHSL